jgi:hypothetical protein
MRFLSHERLKEHVSRKSSDQNFLKKVLVLAQIRNFLPWGVLSLFFTLSHGWWLKEGIAPKVLSGEFFWERSHIFFFSIRASHLGLRCDIQCDGFVI